MPVLARIVEAAGIPTVIVTMMPALADKFHAARTLGVEFPFGHAFGMPHDPAMQRTVAQAALALYEQPPALPNTPLRVDLLIPWPVDQKVAYKAWQPKEAAPIVRYNQQQAASARAGSTQD